MAPNVAYEKERAKKEVEKMRDVKYDSRDRHEQRYSACEKDKSVEDRCRVQYVTSGGTDGARLRPDELPAAAKEAARKSAKPGSGAGRRRSGATSSPKERASGTVTVAATPPTLDEAACAARPRRPPTTTTTTTSEKRCDIAPAAPTAVSGRCYETRRPPRPRRPCCDVRWQWGKYRRDECGSGVVPVRFDFGPYKRLWCCTPLSMYQATVGELGKQLLCRERVIPRDVRPEPPCNVAEYIMPLCRGYYRRYDCVRPCEEEHAYVKRGRKHYRDRVERYWEPCLSRDQKHQLDLNEYGPHNAALALKLRRENMGIPCW